MNRGRCHKDDNDDGAGGRVGRVMLVEVVMGRVG